MSTGERHHGSPVRLLVPLLLFSLAASAPTLAASEVLPASFRLVTADRAGLTIEYAAPPARLQVVDTPEGPFQRLTLPGHLAGGMKGQPALPARSTGLAIPEGVDPKVTWEILETAEYPSVLPLPVEDGYPAPDADLEEKGGWSIDRAAYRTSAAVPPPVRYSEVGHLRHHRVGQIAMTPFAWDPTSRQLTQIRRARIRVDFGEPAAAPGRGTVRPVFLPVGEEPAWEETYRGSLLNYESARAFRSRPASVPVRAELDTESSGRASPATGNPEFRLFVRTTGLYAATFNELAGYGWPAGVATGDLVFYEKSYNPANPSQPLIRDVPIRVVEAEGGTPAVFDGDDTIYFYGLNYLDRFQPNYGNGRYSHIHACWLSWRTGGQPPMASLPAWFESASAVTPATYIHESHWEEDRKYIYVAPPGATSGALTLPQIDTHYWLGADVEIDSLDFRTPGRDPAQNFRLRARWQGIFSGDHYVTVWVTRGGCELGTVGSDTLLLAKQRFATAAAYVFDTGYTVPGARLADGCNRFKVRGNGFANGDPNSAASGAYFDWFDIDYPRRYVANSGFLRFTSAGATGDVEFAIRGLTTNSAIVFDITDSLAPRWVDITPDLFTQINVRPPREYELRFRVNIDRQHTYVLYDPAAVPSFTAAVPVNAMPPDQGVANLAADTARDVTVDTGADVIVLGHPSFMPYFLDWKARREASGHRVTVVDPQDVYDQFSGGDKSVPAIRTWLRHLYRRWAVAPDYLVIIGDANEDYRNDLGESDPDWVPTMMFYGPVVGTDSRYELVGSDHWYVAALGTADTENDPLPEMYVGRMSVGTAAEAQAFADKLAAYDQYGPGDTWRNRGLIVSDDQFSQPISGAQNYCYQLGEWIFEEAGDSLQTVIGASSCYTGFDLQHWRLRDFLAPLNRPLRCLGTDEFNATLTFARQTATPAWVQASSLGHLFQMYSGHANRFVMATERFVEFSGSFISPDARVTEQLTNYGKPFIFFGVGCHLNEYENFQERETKHSLAESMLLLPGRGAIATIASTGYEWLVTNEGIELYLGDVFFSQHPRDGVTGRPRCIVGEATYQALVRLLTEAPLNSDPYAIYYRDTIRTYCLLGDPTLRYDMAPPSLQVSVDGEPVEPGTELRAPAGSDQLAFSVRLADDVDERPEGFTISLGDSVVPAAAYTMTPFQSSTRGACSGYRADYQAHLDPANYTITFRAADWLGRTMEFPLQVRTLNEFQIDGRTLADGEQVPVDAPVHARLTSPIGLTSAEVEFLVDGQPGSFQVAQGSDDREWSGILQTGLPVGQVVLAARVRGEVVSTVRLVVRGDVAFSDLYFYPSPWEGDGPGYFTYQLSYRSGAAPTRTEITVYSISGRKVVTIPGTTGIGRNRVTWDMRDQRGDPVANGVYLYRISVSGGERNFSEVDRLVVHR